jgi:hypothetical protein
VKLWGLVAFFEELRRKRAFNKTVVTLSKTLAALLEGESAVATFEGKEVKFIRKGDWFEAFVSYEKGVWEPLEVRRPKPEVQHYHIDGIHVSVGMDSNDWVDAMLDTYPQKKQRYSDPWPD